MLLSYAQNELCLLLFSLMVPIGVTALGMVSCIKGFFVAETSESDEASESEQAIGLWKKADSFSAIAIAFVAVGLVAAIFHVGASDRILYMFSGVTRSPLSNEIVVTGIAVAIALLYWIIAVVKHPGRGFHRLFGIVLIVLGLGAGGFTGAAYDIPTVLTWTEPYSVLGQVFLALLGGSALSAMILVFAGFGEDGFGAIPLVVLGVIGAIGTIAVVFAQGDMAALAISSAGVTLGERADDYRSLAIGATLLVAVGIALWIMGSLRSKKRSAVTVLGCVAVLVALVLVRIDFYGIFLPAGIM